MLRAHAAPCVLPLPTRFLCALLLGTALLCCALPATAAEVSGVDVPDTIHVGDTPLTLNGAAMRKKFIIKVYVGALYLPQKRTDAAAILAADEPRQMRLTFVRGVDADAIRGAWTDGVKDNVNYPSPALLAKVERLNALMADVAEHETMTLTYVPGQGTSVNVAGGDMGVIPGKDLADAILSTWIGPDPGPGSSFKKAVLGGE